MDARARRSKKYVAMHEKLRAEVEADATKKTPRSEKQIRKWARHEIHRLCGGI
jgi:hypothetical protein